MEFEKVREIIMEELHLKEEDITLDTNLSEDLGVDSLDLYQVILNIQDQFDVEFPDEIFENDSVKTVRDCVEALKTELAKKA
ncbi:MAG: acyl carrier protein [Lachnospiraceae bacterium]|nr:acyl carrier protein [Lachnospiraceae bacterium]MCD8129941.1 acyl carrier protein [Lachnospiraceae bacterium]